MFLKGIRPYNQPPPRVSDNLTNQPTNHQPAQQLTRKQVWAPDVITSSRSHFFEVLRIRQFFQLQALGTAVESEPKKLIWDNEEWFKIEQIGLCCWNLGLLKLYSGFSTKNDHGWMLSRAALQPFLVTNDSSKDVLTIAHGDDKQA